ncbi:hypothetical protein MASR2M78_10640 [Treponema sp.]
MAHQLIGFYTVADSSDGVLKVLRSYQYIAANAISNRVSKIDWKSHNGRGGYVWHTTANINEFGRFDELKGTVDKRKAKAYFDRLEGADTAAFQVNIKLHNLLKKFILSGGFDI